MAQLRDPEDAPESASINSKAADLGNAEGSLESATLLGTAGQLSKVSVDSGFASEGDVVQDRGAGAERVIAALKRSYREVISVRTSPCSHTPPTAVFCRRAPSRAVPVRGDCLHTRRRLQVSLSAATHAVRANFPRHATHSPDSTPLTRRPPCSTNTHRHTNRPLFLGRKIPISFCAKRQKHCGTGNFSDALVCSATKYSLFFFAV